jgi:hypothetical protein
MKENEMKLNIEKFDEMYDEAAQEHRGRVDEATLTGLLQQMLK